MNPVSATQCPELTVLQHFLRDGLRADHADRVESHVVRCPACQEILEQLVQTDSVERILKSQANLLFAEEFRQSPGPYVDEAPGGTDRSVKCNDQRPRESPRDNGDLPQSIGGYRVVAELGRGSFGIVYRAHDESLDRTVAIKVPHPDVVQRAGGVRPLLAEARVLARLCHPYIVQVYEAKADPDVACFVVAQYVGGMNLAERIAKRMFTPSEAVRLLLPITDALQHAHEQGIVHRDIKPANILLDPTGRPFLADFGLAMRDVDAGSGPWLLGTPAYMSPEQARGEGHRVDGRTDIYSLGVVLYRLLTGRRPFMARHPADLLDLVANVDPPSARQKNRRVPRSLDRICAKALARDTARRYASASELQEALLHWLDAVETPARIANCSASAASFATTAEDTLLPDHLQTIGEFRLRQRIGCGATGVVYRAWQRTAEREVAVKCLTLNDERTRTRFLTEIRALGSVQHPNLVQVYSAGSTGDRLYYAMELIDGIGGSRLIQYLRTADRHRSDEVIWCDVVREATSLASQSEDSSDDHRGPASPEAAATGASIGRKTRGTAEHSVCESSEYMCRVVEAVRNIALATQALHNANIVHRDIKPDNILFSRDGERVVLTDLGVAKLTTEGNQSVTRTREFVGSLRYASPEQVIDAAAVDSRTDIYSLGATLWELLTLRPFLGIESGDADSKAMLKIELHEPKPVRSYNRSASVDLQAVVHKCLEKRPEHRYQTARELADDLDRVLRQKPVNARPVRRVARCFRRMRRQPVVPVLVVSIFLMGLVLMGSLLSPSERSLNTVRVGVKPWVGFAPLVVAARLGLCESTDLELVPVRTTSDVGRRVLAGELEFASYLVDSHALARANRIPTRAILMLDTSLSADGVVAKAGIETFADLRGKSVAYMHHEAPHFLLLGLCEQHGLELAGFRHVKTETALEAVDAFLSGHADAVVTYEPFLSQVVSERSGSRLIASAADDPGSIIDLLTVREDFLAEHRHKVEDVIRAWFRGLELLQSGDPAALQVACAFLGTAGEPISVDAFREMERGMMYGTRDANLRFFRRDARGSNEFRERMNAAQQRWSAYHQLPRWTDPADAESDLFLKMHESP